MILQLDPTIPMVTPRGKGNALFMINPSDEHNIQWVVGLDNNEIWTFQNPEVRLQSNITLGRMPDKRADRCDPCGFTREKLNGAVCKNPTCPISD